MLNQIITTISSFNSVTAEDPAIKTQPQLEQVQTEIKGPIAKDDTIIKFQIGKNEEYTAISKPDEIKLKQYCVIVKDEAYDKEKHAVKEVESAKTLLRVFKEGDDTSVALNFQNISEYLETKDEEVFKKIKDGKIGTLQSDLTAFEKKFQSVENELKDYVTEDTFNVFDAKYGEAQTAFTAIDSKDKLPAFISSLEALKASIGTLTLTAKDEQKIIFTAQSLKEVINKLPVEELKKALDNLNNESTTVQEVLDAILPAVKAHLTKQVDAVIAAVKEVQQNLNALELYKKLSDANFGFSFQVTFKGAKDDKITKTIQTIFFIIKDKKIVEVKQETLHVVENDSSKSKESESESKPFYKKIWFWALIIIVAVAGIGIICYFVFGKGDEDNDE